MNYPDELKIQMDRLAAIQAAKAASKIPLGCHGGPCYCTGRCRRTLAEQQEYERFQQMVSGYVG